MDLLGFCFGGSGLRVGAGWGFCVIGGSLVGVGLVTGGFGLVTGGFGLVISTFCTVLSGQSRLLEEHFWLKRACWKESVVSAGEPVTELELSETIMYLKVHRNAVW